MCIDSGMDKEDVVYVCVLFTQPKGEWNNATCNNMDGTGDDHTEWSQTKTNIILSFIMCNLKKWYKWTYLQNKNRLKDIKSKLMITKGGGEG